MVFKKYLVNYSVVFLLVLLNFIHESGGGLMDKKWMMMKWLMDKHHESKGITIGLKPIAIPIPLPVPIPVMKGDSKGSNPWAEESNDMLWKMMMMKMKKMKGPKKAAMPMMMCCPEKKKMKMKWPMMKMKAPKAAPMMCCPQMMSMMKGGWKNGCTMMKGGWSSPEEEMTCCKPSDGWDEEEEEEEEWPEYYDDDEEEEEEAGWDTKVTPDYKRFDDSVDASRSRRGDDYEDLQLSETRRRNSWVSGSGLMPRRKRFFHYHAHHQDSYEYEYDF